MQGANLEKELAVRVMDRAELILDIFSTRARSHEARLQVELAQLRVPAAPPDAGCGPTSRASAAASASGAPAKPSWKPTAG